MRNYVFLVDASSSMQGSLAYQAVDLLKGALKSVKSKDIFNVVLFGTEQKVLSHHSFRGTRYNKRMLIKWVKNEEFFGGTDLEAAMSFAHTDLKTAMSVAHRIIVGDTTTIFVVITDDYSMF